MRTTAATSRPAARAASIVSSVWLIVPRPGEAAIDQREAEVDGEVADQVAGRERHEQAADALADQRLGARRRRARRCAQPRRVDLLAGQRRRQVRRGRRAVAVGRDLLVALARAGGAAQQLVVGLAGLVEAGDARA